MFVEKIYKKLKKIIYKQSEKSKLKKEKIKNTKKRKKEKVKLSIIH